jgi:preprotein translocase subunit SecD
MVRLSNIAITLIALTTLLSGCDEMGYVAAPPRHLVVKAGSATSIETTERVLSARFHQYLPSLFSSMKSERNSDEIVFTFERGAPTGAIVHYLVDNPGHLKITSPDGRVWLTEQDIEDAGASPGSGEDNGLLLTVGSAAEAQIVRLSESSQGQKVLITLDEQLLASPRLRGPISNRLRIPVKKEMTELRLITTLLRSGALPARASIVRSDLEQ